MSDEPGVQFMGARSKRTHRQMSHESSDGGQQSWHRHFHPPFPERTASRPARLPSMRPPRDGFDFRRPAATTPHEEGDVIDLTNEPETPPHRTQPRTSENRTSSTSRLPRFGRNILADVVDLEEEPDDDPGEGPSSSPEVQFVRATVRSQPQRRWDHLSIFQGNFPHPLRARQEPDSLRVRPSVSLLRERTSRLLQGFHEVDHLFLAADPPGLNGDPEEVLLDYGQSSFSMGTSHLQETRPRRDTYQAPSPAPEGFTRTLAEDDVAVCPNCSWELGTGEGKKQEIWVAKPCGHVYCGECTENRSLSRAKKSHTSPKTKPFSKCQVADCGKQVSAPTAMFHLFL